MRIYDIRTGEEKAVIAKHDNATIRAVCFEPDNSKLLIHEDNSVYYTLYEYDVETGVELNSLRLPIESEYMSLSSAKTLFNTLRNQIIICYSTTKEEKYAWFIDMDSFKIVAETNDRSECFMTFIEETQEMLLKVSGKELGAYPYLTTSELIERAEDLIKKNEQ